jgi:hypothetical protein
MKMNGGRFNGIFTLPFVLASLVTLGTANNYSVEDSSGGNPIVNGVFSRKSISLHKMKYIIAMGLPTRINLSIFGRIPGMTPSESGEIYLGIILILAIVISSMVLFFWLIAVIIELFRKKS